MEETSDPKSGTLCYSRLAEAAAGYSFLPLLAHSQVFKNQGWAQAGREGVWDGKCLHPTATHRQERLLPQSLLGTHDPYFRFSPKNQYPGPRHTILTHTTESQFLGRLPFQNSTSAINHTEQGSRSTSGGFSQHIFIQGSHLFTEESLCGCAYRISP